MTNPRAFFNIRGQHSYFEESSQPRREVRSNYAPISNPQKLINPFSIFKGFLSGELKEEEQNIFPALSTFNYFKSISEVIFDKNRKVVSAYLENDPIWSATSWSEVVGNFGSEQAQNLLECSKVIESFGSSMDKLDQLSKQLKASAVKPEFGMRKEDFDKLHAIFEKEYPCFYIKAVMKHHNPTTLEYNAKFLNLLGYEPSEFSSKILRHGIPEIYPNMQRKYSHMLKDMIQILISGKYDGKPLVNQVYLLHSNLNVSSVTEKAFLMRSLNEDQELEIEMIFIFENFSEPIKVEEEFRAVLGPKVAPPATNEQETAEFLKKFYNIKKRDESDLARTCKIRFL